jgi:outer membrane receptor protein involved in Fe transport
MLIFNRAALVTALCLASITVFAEEFPSYFNMSLQELLQIRVSVASPNSERIINTPAIVSRYDMQDMSGMGLRTLKDLLSFIPGFVLQDSRSGGTTVMIRGLVEAFNQKVLFMLYGVPYWMPSHSEIPLLGMPLEAISHVEVIRGPGAVIYGSNASAGVINIITKQTPQSVVAFSAGSHNKINGGGYIYQGI